MPFPGNPGFPVDNLITASGLLTSHGLGFGTADGNYHQRSDGQFRPRRAEPSFDPQSVFLVPVLDRQFGIAVEAVVS